MELRILQILRFTGILVVFITSSMPAISCQNYNGTRKCPVLLSQYDVLSRFTKSAQTENFRAWKWNSRIVGGTRLESTLETYFAALFFNKQYYYDKFICSAVVVGVRTIITAAHCIEYANVFFYKNRNVPLEKRFTVYFGVTRRSSKYGTARSVKSFFVHPRYNFSFSLTAPFDVAFLTLGEDIPTSNKYMKVNSNDNIPMVGSVVRQAGYGFQKGYEGPNGYGSYNTSEAEFQQVDLPVTSFSYCYNEYKKRRSINLGLIRNKQICAGYMKGGCSPCYGDSGGPLLQYDRSGAPVLLGVIANGYACGTDTVPSVAVRVSPFLGNFFPKDLLTITNSTEQLILDDDQLDDPFTFESSQTQSQSPSQSSSPAPTKSTLSSPSQAPSQAPLLTPSQTISAPNQSQTPSPSISQTPTQSIVRSPTQTPSTFSQTPTRSTTHVPPQTISQAPQKSFSGQPTETSIETSQTAMPSPSQTTSQSIESSSGGLSRTVIFVISGAGAVAFLTIIILIARYFTPSSSE